MSGFNGSGTFNISGVGLPYVSGTTISSSVANQLNTDLATGLSTCITKDGQSTVTANIGWNNFNINNLSALGIGTASPTGKMEIKSGSTTDFIIDSSGNVGIGTIGGTYKLRVQSTTGNSTVNAQGRSDVSGAGAAFYVSTRADSTDAVGTSRVSVGTYNAITGSGTDTSPAIWGYQNEPLLFGTYGSERMRIDASGYVGIGTSSPASKLTVSGLTTGNVEPEILLTRTGTASSLVGQGPCIQLQNATENTGGIMQQYSGNIQFFNYTPSPGWVERMRIDSAGHLLIGTTGIISNSNANLEVYQNGGTDTIVAQNTSSSANILSCWNSSSTGNNVFITFYTDSSITSRGQISYNRSAGLTNYGQTSDYRAKTVNGLIENALTKVALLKPSIGRMNGADFDIDFFVAHELQEVVPYAVIGKKDAFKTEKYEVSPEIKDDQGNVITQAVIGTREVPEYQMVDKSALIPLLTAAIQELKAELDTVKTELAALKGS